jgi:hypothetical protein
LNSISRRTEGPFLDFSPHVPAIARSTTVTGAVQARCIVLVPAVGILESDIDTKAKYIEVCTARRRLKCSGNLTRCKVFTSRAREGCPPQF